MPVLLVPERQSLHFIRLLGAFGLVPRLTVRCAGDLDQARSAIAQLERDRWSGQLLLSAELFNRLHAVIAPSPAAKRLIVI